MPPPAKSRDASPWLIAERARCRLEGVRKAKKLFLQKTFLVALQDIEGMEVYYENIIKDPKPTGVPGE